MTGFVDADAGSVTSANSLLLRELLRQGVEVHWFSKASFVDPRPVVAGLPGFTFTDVDNRRIDRFRARVLRVPLLGLLAVQADVWTYNRMLVRAVARAHRDTPFDACVWLGDYARRMNGSVPVVSFAQGPPGTDARSITRRFPEIVRLAGRRRAWTWRLLAWLRLRRRPAFAASDLIVVGSEQSARTLQEVYGVASGGVLTLPYPVDLHTFRPDPVPGERVRVLWLGRIVPRKRLDLFLDGAAAAIRAGADLDLTVVGPVGFVPGYERLLDEFPFPERLTRIESIPRTEVPALLHRHDVLVQPSEEENFGSSVAEAQACGLAVVVGHTNGNADYLGPGDVHLRSDDPAELAEVLAAVKPRDAGEVAASREIAERWFAPDTVARRFTTMLEDQAERGSSRPSL